MTNTESKKIGEKPKLSELMATGQGLQGFPWPENCGDFDMRIGIDGTWYYRNSPIGRKALCQLFATVLQKDDEGRYWLVTPVERGLVQVDDAPFTIVEMQQKKVDDIDEIHFCTNLSHWFRLDKNHPISLHPSKDIQEIRPYAHVRDGLEGLIVRSVYYDLVNLAELKDDDTLSICSAGEEFLLGNLREE